MIEFSDYTLEFFNDPPIRAFLIVNLEEFVEVAKLLVTASFERSHTFGPMLL